MTATSMAWKKTVCPGVSRTLIAPITLLALSGLALAMPAQLQASDSPAQNTLGLSAGKTVVESMDEPLSVSAALPVSLSVPLSLPSKLSGTSNVNPDGYTVGALPEWVKPTPAFDPTLPMSAKATHGFHSRLHEFQFNGLVPGESSYFKAVEYALTNQHGVENYSGIEISFDPGYERLQLHELWIKRGDRLMDKLPTARFDLLRTESERHDLIYDGTRTFAVLLDDVRSGDMIRYSYSVHGENPIFQGKREFKVYTDPLNAVDRQYTRVLTASDKPLNRRVRGHDVELQINDEQGVREIVIDQRGVTEFEIEDDVPSWHYNRGTVVFSDMQDWRSVVEWALPMYQLAERSSAEIATIAGVIRTSQTELDAQVGAALRWVQEEIRYFGVELGRNSHWPSRPEQTLARRFGDCKDKALLLIALLRELGVDAQPALVNTGRGLESTHFPYRLHAFDHVIVHVRLGDESHYIDPTRRNQSGSLGDMHEPDYGRALILSPATTGLSEMDSRRSAYRMSVHKTLSLSVPEATLAGALPTTSVTPKHESMDDAESGIRAMATDHKAPPKDDARNGSTVGATGDGVRNRTGGTPLTATNTGAVARLTTVTTKSGRLAESVRHGLETDGVRGLGEAYAKYYVDYFRDIAALTDPVFEEHPGNQMVVTEHYQIPQMWQSDGNVERYRWIYADEILGYLDMPEKTADRQLPYEILHPVMLEETWDILMPSTLRTDDLEAAVNTQWMTFSKESTLSEDGKRLSVHFRYQTLANEVAADDLEEYADAVKRITDMASFYLQDQPTVSESIRMATRELTRSGSISPVMLIAVLLLLTWRLRSQTAELQH